MSIRQTDKQKVAYTYNEGVLSQRRNEVLAGTTTWTKLKNTKLCEICQVLRYILYDSIYETFRIGNLKKTK